MDEDDRKPTARDDEEMIDNIESNDDVMVDPTDNTEDINSGIFNSEVSVNEDPFKNNNNNDNNNNDGPISFAWGHENLTKTDVEDVAYIISHWKLHPFCYVCYNCNQQLVKVSQGKNWGCLCPIFLISQRAMNMITGSLENVPIARTLDWQP
jgi:hypothetical protein